jgi:hypothetical protein
MSNHNEAGDNKGALNAKKWLTMVSKSVILNT